MLERGDGEGAYYFARHVPGSDRIVLLEKTVSTPGELREDQLVDAKDMLSAEQSEASLLSMEPEKVSRKPEPRGL